MKLLIGLVGEPLAGKESVGDLLLKLASQNGLTIVRRRFRDVLEQTLALWDIKVNRPNLQKMAQIMVREDGFGAEALAHAIRSLFTKDTADIVIADGIRWLADEEMVRDISPNFIIYITADAQTRFARQKARGREGEKDMSFEEFLKQGQQKNEINISNIGLRADLKIENNGTVEEFLALIEKTYKENIEPLLI